MSDNKEDTNNRNSNIDAQNIVQGFAKKTQ